MTVSAQKTMHQATGSWALTVRNVTKRFGGNLVNDNVSMRLAPGEVRGLVGPNGAGKTTFLNVISGVYAPDSGTIALGAHDLTGLSLNAISRLGLIRTFQVPKLFGDMTVLENLLLPFQARNGWFKTRDVVRAQDRAAELLELTDLTRLKESPAKNLSGGQQALLQMAAGFMVDGIRCYLLDEAFAGMSVVAKERAYGLIDHFRAGHSVSFLVVTHEMASVRRLCDSVTVMAEGRVIAEGSLDEVISDGQVISAYLGRARAN